MDPKQAIELGKANGAVMVDLKFIDLPGKWQHTSVPFDKLEESSFEDGVGFDGSSIRGFQPINESDMLLIPDPETAVMDPFTKHPTLSLQCTIQDTLTRQNYSRDPRHIARKAEAYLKSSGRATYVAVTDDHALEGFRMLCETEGIIPALESSHAVHYAAELAAKMDPEALVLVNLSGRGDKDLGIVSRLVAVQE